MRCGSFAMRLWMSSDTMICGYFPDADRASEAAMRRLESDLDAQDVSLFCCAAQPEVEIYACVAFQRELGLMWDELRSHPHLKEDVFQSLLERHGDRTRLGGGRDLLLKESLRNLPLLFRLCPELKHLRDRVAKHISSR